jgi:hypothetical protein
MASIGSALKRWRFSPPDALAVGMDPSAMTFGLAGLLAAAAALAVRLAHSGLQRLP